MFFSFCSLFDSLVLCENKNAFSSAHPKVTKYAFSSRAIWSSNRWNSASYSQCLRSLRYSYSQRVLSLVNLHAMVRAWGRTREQQQQSEALTYFSEVGYLRSSLSITVDKVRLLFFFKIFSMGIREIEVCKLQCVHSICLWFVFFCCCRCCTEIPNLSCDVCMCKLSENKMKLLIIPPQKMAFLCSSMHISCSCTLLTSCVHVFFYFTGF